ETQRRMHRESDAGYRHSVIRTYRRLSMHLTLIRAASADEVKLQLVDVPCALLLSVTTVCCRTLEARTAVVSGSACQAQDARTLLALYSLVALFARLDLYLKNSGRTYARQARDCIGRGRRGRTCCSRTNHADLRHFRQPRRSNLRR